ncbi:TPA: hypothetical protein ACGWTM_002983 [Legionella pneumophila]
MFKHLYFGVALGLCISGSTTAKAFCRGSLGPHEESVTGPLDIHYIQSKSKHPLRPIVKNIEQEERETVFIRPFIHSIETNYDNCNLIRTSIKTGFQLQVLGFYPESGEQLYNVRRKVCIVPDEYSSNDELSCFNSSETLSISKDGSNDVDVDIDVYNLKTGKYFIDVQMFVEHINQATSWPIAFSAMAENRGFNVTISQHCKKIVD